MPTALSRLSPEALALARLVATLRAGTEPTPTLCEEIGQALASAARRAGIPSSALRREMTPPLSPGASLRGTREIARVVVGTRSLHGGEAAHLRVMAN